MNHEDRLLVYEERLTTVEEELESVPGVATSLEHVPQYFGSTLNVTFDFQTVGKTAQDISEELDGGNPRIWVTVVDEQTIAINAHGLNEGEELIVADGIRTAAGG